MTDDPPGIVAVFTATVSPELARSLDLGGYRWKQVESADAAAEHEPDAGWQAVLLDTSEHAESAWSYARSVRHDGETDTKILAMLTGAQIAELELRDDLYDDFCLVPFHPAEFEARLRHLLWGTGERPVRHDLLEYGALALNVETYQATIGGRPLDLTYMEYELLKFLCQAPGKVFTREVLLSRVWGYEYYGGARTVDVHVRRLRAKLGEEHAGLIQTVRSVGYRFGQSRWDKS